MIKINPGGVLNMMSNQVISNIAYPYASIYVDTNGIISTQRIQGFYDGTAMACINSNMSFSLNQFSIIEYNGNVNQVVTGNFSGIPPLQNQYGVLKINMQNNSAKAMMNFPVIVRTRLILTNGELNLGGKTLTINSGTPTSITRATGFVNSELSGGIPGTIIWKNMKGYQEFPFGVNASSYLPVRFFFMVGGITDVTASTYATPTTDNLPLPIVNGTNVNFSSVATSYPISNLIDRWWNISAPGVIAGLTVSYLGIENTMDPGYQTGAIGIVSWTGSGWSAPACVGSGVTGGIGTVSAEIISDFSALTVGRQAGLKAISNIRSFTAEQVGDEVALNWSTDIEYNSDYFSIERSSDGNSFEELSHEKATGNSTNILRYASVDTHPPVGKSYYRIRQVSKSGANTFSSVQEVMVSPAKIPALSVESLGPNPFESGFDMNYKLGKSSKVRFEISSGSGQLIHQSEVDETEGTHTFTFAEGAILQPGIYFLKVTSDETSITRKLVKK